MTVVKNGKLSKNVDVLKDVQRKINAIFSEISGSLFEREEEIELTLVSILSQSSLLFVGPPGTAKSFALEKVINQIEGAQKFLWLMGKFTEPDEIFGPVDILSLKQGIRKRNTEWKLPKAHFVFLDEFFKCSTAIGNALLRIVNERVYNDGSVEVKVPLRTLVAASNEYNVDGEMGAMFDRFILRKEINYISSSDNILKLIKTSGNPSSQPITTITLKELDIATEASSKVSISEEVYNIIFKIVSKCFENNVRPSDRRLCNINKIVKSYAYLLGSEEVLDKHLSILSHLLWVDPSSHIPIVRNIVEEFSNTEKYKLNNLKQQYESILKEIPSKAVEQTVKKYGDVQVRLLNIKNQIEVLEESSSKKAFMEKLTETLGFIGNKIITLH